MSVQVVLITAVTLPCASTLLAAITAPVLMAMMVMDSTVQVWWRKMKARPIVKPQMLLRTENT